MDEYMAAYETALKRCSANHALWHVIPANHNLTSNVAISRIVRLTPEKLSLADGRDPKTIVGDLGPE